MFLHPWAIAMGVLAVGLPLAIHLLTKPRPVKMPLSTLRFVRESVRQKKVRHRLRDFLILALRTLAILLLALAIARPRLGEQPLVSDSQSGSKARVVILDVSQSMAALDGGAQRIQRARSTAEQYVRYRPGLRVNLILAGASPKSVFQGLSQNFDALSKELSQAKALGDRLDINSAIELAAQQLAPFADEKDRRLELVVVSDFQRTNWARADFSVLPERTNIQLEAAASNEAPDNIGLLDARVRPVGATGGQAELEVAVGNYTKTPRQLTVEVTLGDSVTQLKGLCPPGRRTTLTKVIKLPTAGWQLGAARLVGIEDALSADDSRGLVTEVTQAPRYALITRQSEADRPSSPYFLQSALAPLEGRRIDPAEFDRTTAAEADLIVIDHPGKIQPEDLGFLSGLLRRGRGLLYMAAEPIDATNLQVLGEKAGGGLQLPVRFTPPQRGIARRELFLASYRQSDAPFNVFGDSVKSVTSSLRFAGGLASSRIENTLEDDVLATFSDGSACLVLTSSEAGKLAVFNTDLARSNLPTSTAFVPLLDQLVEQLLEGRDLKVRAVPGEPLFVRLPSGIGAAEELEIKPTREESTANDLGQLATDESGVVWRWASPKEQGVYRVVRGDQTVFALPVASPAEESALDSLSPEVLTQRLSGGRASQFQTAGASRNQRDTLWTWVLVACVGCVIGEVVTLALFKS